MASLQSNLLLLLLGAAAAAAAADETTTSVRFYMHDTMSGSSPSAMRVVQGPNSTGLGFGNGFGDVYVVDDPLTEGPAADSALVGRAQGFYAFASQRADAAAQLLCLNLVFPNGSTVAVMGHDPIYAPQRELPVVGGTGAFRLALGYVLVRTHTRNTSSGDAVSEWQLHLAANSSAQIDPSSTSTPSSGPSSRTAAPFPSFHFSLFCILILHIIK
ncbi:dirigent protein 21-like [Zingiber officinale]|uniref:Dirigent protein n=1 Tax=Zingiber officinale TaxID=94328 RepID=A0A8J5GYZ1_ZINOF|nr:dirigent protein 21-like [Zingiber officinale]KAG6517136.1 hypothetical protein ZIOFF_020516 [Zingiber officinale]